MDWTKPDVNSDSARQPIDRIDYDVLRALLRARQDASPTVRMLQNAPVQAATPCPAIRTTVMGRLSGRATSDGSQSMDGAFWRSGPSDDESGKAR